MIAEAKDMDELIERLNDPSILVAHIPVALTPSLENSAERWMSENAYINQMTKKFNRIDTVNELHDLHDTPFQLNQTRISESLTLKDEFLLQTRRGQTFNFNATSIKRLMQLEDANDLSSFVLQAGDEFAVGPDKHRDENAITINFYLHGNGVQYGLGETLKNVSLTSPVITAHRGLRHPLCAEDESLAAEHKRRDDSCDRANIIYGIG